MIFILTIIISLIIAILVNLILNGKKIKNITEGNNKKIVKNTLLATVCFFVLAITVIPMVLNKAIPFGNANDYLFWVHGKQVEGSAQVSAFAELDEGTAYAVDNHVLTGFLTEENDRIISHEVEFVKMESLVDDNRFGIILHIFKVEDLEKYVIISHNNASEEGFEVTIENTEAIEYQKQTAGNMKINIVEQKNPIVIIFNGQEFTLEIF